MEALIFLVLVTIACTFIGAYASRAKGRSGWEGGIFGFLLGPIGVLIALCFPTVRPITAEPAVKPQLFDDLPGEATHGHIPRLPEGGNSAALRKAK